MQVDEAQNKYLKGDFKLRGEFMSGNGGRSTILHRAEQYAGWTLPNVFPRDVVVEDEEVQHDYQSVGASCVTNLSNKIMMALFQPSKPFFRLQLDQAQKATMLEQGLTEAEITAALSQVEREGMRDLDKTNARVVMTDMIQYLIITGNALLYTSNSGMQVYSLRDYSVERDLRGNVVKSIIRETKQVLSLSDDLRSLAIASGYNDQDEVSIFTGIQRIDDEKYLIWQELEDLCYCHKKIGVKDKKDLPWLFLTWNLSRGKNYGTGLVENYAGDFFTLSTLAEAILDYTTVVTDVKNLVNPTGQTNVREITNAKSGAYVQGRQEDLFAYTAAGDMGNASAFLEAQFNKIERRLGSAFLLNSAVTRDAERVTAAEIRLQAHELESSLGGVYSRLSVELQLPLARMLISKLDSSFKEIEPIIVTGFESLSRNSDLDNFRSFMQDLIILADVPEEVTKRLKFGDVIAVLSSGHGVDASTFLKDEDTVRQEDQQRRQAEASQAGMEAGAVAQAEGQTQRGR
jgi:hypothetical protein